MKVQLKSTDGTENLYPVTSANSVIFPDGNNLEAKFPELVGKSAYQSWLDAGHTGTESDFLEWLKGVGFQSVSSQQDGTIVITLTSGDTVTIDLNHTHPDKQDLLVSGTNVKTINGNSILGSGNLDVGANITVDSALSSSSENPVQNKVVKTAVDSKQDTLVSGNNIKTINNTSLLGSGNITISSEPGPQGPAGQSAIKTRIDYTASETTPAALAWDTMHVWPEVASLTFALATAPSDGYEHQITIIFDTPTDLTDFNLGVPSTLLWGNNINLANNLSASTRYEVNINSGSLIALYTEAALSTE